MHGEVTRHVRGSVLDLRAWAHVSRADAAPTRDSARWVEMTAYSIRSAWLRWRPGRRLSRSPAAGSTSASPDLFVLHRTGQGSTLTLLVNDGGTIRCNGGKPKSLSDPLLLDARDLAKDLDGDATDNLRFTRPAKVFTYRVQLQDGTMTFSDMAATNRKHPELARAVLFAAQAAQGPCGLTG